jgi:hypothetical protein
MLSTISYTPDPQLVKGETHSAFSNDRNKFHPIEQVDWNGNRYWKGMILKLTAWMMGQTFQFATIAAVL